MARKDYTYPHVNITTRALQRRTPVVAESSATTLLAPFTCDRGPENELVPIDTMADFISTFGELDYSIPDQRQILNMGRWIAGGGRLLACRITDINKKYTSEAERQAAKAIGETARKNGYSVKITARYSGEFYNGLEINFVQQTNNSYDVSVVKDGVAIERFRNKRVEDFYTIENASQYIGEIAIIDYTEDNVSGVEVESFGTPKFEIGKVVLSGGKNVNDNILFGTPKETSGEVLGQGRIGENELIPYMTYTESIYEAIKNELTVDVEIESNNSIIHIVNGAIKYITVNAGGDNEETYRVKRILETGENPDLYVFGTEVWYYQNAGSWYISDEEPAESEYKKQCYAPFVIEYVEVEEVTEDDYDSMLESSLREILKQPLETPFDVMLDCGYPLSVKKDLRRLFTEDSGDFPKRDDAFLYLSDCVILGNGRRNRSSADLSPDRYSDLGTISDGTNVAVINHYHKVKDIYSAVSGKEVFVPSTYFLAYLIPYYDMIDGPQWPVSGQTRGVIQNSLWIDHIPSNSEKQENYENHLNYIEKDSRGMYIMSQLTNTSQDTALKFINNSRALLKMKKELTLIARRYLHEFNDRITKTNIYNALNSYLANWIQNRTLSFGSIGLYDYTQNEALTNEELLITLDIKFTGTIEIISFDITVE